MLKILGKKKRKNEIRKKIYDKEVKIRKKINDKVLKEVRMREERISKLKKELRGLKGYAKLKKLEVIRRLEKKQQMSGVGFVKRKGLKWISDRKIARIVGIKKGKVYKELTGIKNLVKRWNAVKKMFIRIRKPWLFRYKSLKKKYLMFRVVKNNVMGTLVDGYGRVIVKRTGGEVGFKGSKRNSSVAASAVGTVMGEVARRRRIKRVVILLKGRLGYKCRLFLKGFFKGGMKIGGVEYRYRHTHKSFKTKKIRRV